MLGRNDVTSPHSTTQIFWFLKCKSSMKQISAILCLCDCPVICLFWWVWMCSHICVTGLHNGSRKNIVVRCLYLTTFCVFHVDYVILIPLDVRGKPEINSTVQLIVSYVNQYVYYIASWKMKSASQQSSEIKCMRLLLFCFVCSELVFYTQFDPSPKAHKFSNEKHFKSHFFF